MGRSFSFDSPVSLRFVTVSSAFLSDLERSNGEEETCILAESYTHLVERNEFSV